MTEQHNDFLTDEQYSELQALAAKHDEKASKPKKLVVVDHSNYTDTIYHVKDAIKLLVKPNYNYHNSKIEEIEETVDKLTDLVVVLTYKLFGNDQKELENLFGCGYTVKYEDEGDGK